MSWPTKKLGEICAFEGGKQPPKKYFIEEPKRGYVRLLQIRDFESDDKAVYIPKKLSQNWVKKDDILISRYGGFRNYKSFFNILTGKSGAFNVALIKAIPDEKIINKKFLYYQLQLPRFKTALIKKSDRAVQSGFRRKDLEDLEVSTPPLPIQRKIIKRLDAIRKTQELNEKQISLADELFQSLLHRELKPRKGWLIRRMDDITTRVSKGESPNWQGVSYTDDGVLFIRSENVLDGDIDPTNAVRIPVRFHEKLKRSQVFADDILLNIVGASIGRAAIYPEDLPVSNVNQAVSVISINKQIALPKFVLYYMLTSFFQKEIQLRRVEGARANISLTDIKSFKIFIPPLKAQRQIVKKLSAIQEYKKKLLKQKELLQELFESTLNKAMKGKLVK